MAGAPYDGGRHPHDGRRDPRRRPTTNSTRRRAARSRRGAARRHHDDRDQVGLRAHRRATSARRSRSPRGDTPETTLLGAHVVPPEFAGRADDYVDLVCGEMLDAAARTCRWIDAFCERGAFDADQCRAVLEAGRAAGLGLRLHANQLGPGPGRAAGRRARVRVGRPLHVPQRRRHRGARRRAHRGDVPPRDRLLDPPAVPRRPPGDRRRRHRRASPPTATRARATRRRCRSASPSPCATCG